MKHKYLAGRVRQGFALPTVLIASVIMLSILVTAVSSIGSATAAINSQYYNQLAREAGESGMARALDCVQQSANFTPQWSDASPLMPNTNCDGSVIPGATQWVVNNGVVRTSFRVGSPSSGSANAIRIATTGNVSLVRTSNQNAVWRTYSQSYTQDNRYKGQPKIAGGAGWQSTGHIAVITSVDNQLYGFGANYGGQVGTQNSPANVLYPTQYSLPAGVTSVVKAKVSGQGASFVCIQGNNNQLYCRGDGLGNPNTTANPPNGYYNIWTQMVLPAGVTVSDFATDGYGKDAVCALGSDQQAYCAGENDTGSLGYGSTTYAVVPLSAPTKFILPAGVNLKKIIVGSHLTCGITTETPYNRVFCSGRNDAGQVGAPTTNPSATPTQWPIPGYRNAKDVSISYHSMDDSPAVHVLMTDGTIWSTGNYAWGDLGNGLTSGSTGTSQTPALFTSNVADWMTGSQIQNKGSVSTGSGSGLCIDNANNSTANGNTIQLFTCNGTEAQVWVYGSSSQLTNRGTGKCLDVPNNNGTAGQKLQLYDCNGTPAQTWDKSTDTAGNTIYKHRSSGLCIDVTGAGTTNGALIELWTCNNGTAQMWTYGNGINGWTATITGMDAFCAIRQDIWSNMWCAGTNTWGQLLNYSQPGSFYNACTGSGPSPSYNIFNVNLPNSLKVDANKLSDEWRQQFKSLQVIATDGNVYSSGRDQYGKFGTGVTGDPSNDYRVCKTYNSVANMKADEPWAGAASSISFQLPAGVTALDMSARDEFTTYVLGSDLRVYAAGRNVNGQIGDGSTNDRATPVMVKLPRVGTSY